MAETSPKGINKISFSIKQMLYREGFCYSKTKRFCENKMRAGQKGIVTKAPFTLYRITSERSDFHTGFGCCLHYTTPIRYAPRSENHSALEVIQK